MKQDTIFCEIPCLTENSRQFSGLSLQKKWFKSADKRIIGQYLNKFIGYNSDQFKFLGVEPFIRGSDQGTYLQFRTSQYIGVVPLKASDTGKQIGDFIVMPRFSGAHRFQEYVEILNLLDHAITPEFQQGLALASGYNFRPPMYLEALKFIQILEKLIPQKWRKFTNEERVLNQPHGQVNWSQYVRQSYKTENQLRFPTRKNILTELHEEYRQLRYVFDLCKAELTAPSIPQNIKHQTRKSLLFLEDKLYLHVPKYVREFTISSKDSQIVQACKLQANKILLHHRTDSLGWRVDFSEVFEKFTQFIFKQVAQQAGGHLYENHRFYRKTAKNYSWELQHVEPDAIYKKDDVLIFIDAKYKAHAYQKNTNSEKLKEDHRHDLHQIMAYGSFNESKHKFGILCYPSEHLKLKKIIYQNGINNVEHTIFILELPLKKEIIPDVKKLISECLDHFNDI